MIEREFFQIAKMLEEKSIRYERDVSLKTLSSFRIGGIAPLVIYPKEIGELIESILLLHGMSVPHEVIGNGSNLLFGDGRLARALVVTKDLCGINCDGTTVTAECGVSLSRLASFAAERGLSGLEFAKGIPGTVGGAVFMNAGAYGGEMSAIVENALVLDVAEGELFTLEDHAFGYRKSIYMECPEWICLAVNLNLFVGDREEIEAKMKEFAQSRREKQPLEYPSAGSYFKRPEGNFAGKLIEDAGLKGMRIGGAAVSEKHAGFLINLGNATAEDMLSLEAKVCEEVASRFGVTLEREVRFIPSEKEEK
ncbi:MAG: UDP-N-acetylmuramate dehydrogenase [Clostridia bacterium]|nr:UDP-N-acetylmuramate dehydrogenase [Clostridia bacterium]